MLSSMHLVIILAIKSTDRYNKQIRLPEYSLPKQYKLLVPTAWRRQLACEYLKHYFALVFFSFYCVWQTFITIEGAYILLAFRMKYTLGKKKPKV